MRPYILSDCNWKNIKRRKIELAILPWGATEAHNFHLPYGTDIIESEKFTTEAARIAFEKGADLIVLPTMPFGVNTGQKDIKLDINLNPSTQYMILSDLIFTLQNQEIYKFLIVNSHGGNDFKQILRELGLKYPKMFLSSCNWYQSLNKNEFFDNDGDHADEMETSLMLYFNPELVLPLDEAGEGKEKKICIEGFSEGWAWTERKWSMVTEDTGIGNPKLATSEKGKRYFNAAAQKLSKLFIEICEIQIDQLYK